MSLAQDSAEVALKAMQSRVSKTSSEADVEYRENFRPKETAIVIQTSNVNSRPQKQPIGLEA